MARMQNCRKAILLVSYSIKDHDGNKSLLVATKDTRGHIFFLVFNVCFSFTTFHIHSSIFKKINVTASNKMLEGLTGEMI